MRLRIFIMLGLAVVVGLGALVFGRVWIDRQVAANAVAPANVTIDQPALGKIVVAAKPLRFGMPVTSDVLAEIPWPVAQQPDGTFATIEALMAEGERVALGPIEVNEPVLMSKVTGPGEHATLSRLINAGSRAVAVRVNDVAGVAGFILPGDRVDVVLTRQFFADPSQPNEKTTVAETILQNVRVLTIDQTADERQEEPVVVDAVTLEVDVKEAQKVALAAEIGKLSLILRPAGETKAQATGTVTISDLTGVAAGPAETTTTRETDIWVNRRDERSVIRVPTAGTPQRTNRTSYIVGQATPAR